MFLLDPVSPAAHHIPRLMAAVMRCLLPSFDVSEAVEQHPWGNPTAAAPQ